MVTRRNFMLAAAAGAALPAVAAHGATESAYEQAVQGIWRAGSTEALAGAALTSELVRCATLAASSHNTQCWRFRAEPGAIVIRPDLTRRCPAIDPDDHHLYASLGCAAENLIHAAQARGLHTDLTMDGGALRLALTPTKPWASPIYDAIPARQSTRGEYDGWPLRRDDLDLLELAGNLPGVRVLMLTDEAMREKVLEFVTQANTVQLADPALMAELKAWIRFSEAEAVASGDGLFARSTGNPSLPRWLGSPLFSLLVTPKGENDKYAKQIRSSAGLAVFSTDGNDPAHWVLAGRAYQRFALQAAVLGVRTAFLNQPVEVAALRPQFARMLGLGERRPDLVLRFGRGPLLPRSLRRPVAAVLDQEPVR